MADGYSFQTQAKRLIDDSLSRLKATQEELEKLIQQTHPTLPAPRAPKRYITKSLILGFRIRPTDLGARGFVILEYFEVRYNKARRLKEIAKLTDNFDLDAKNQWENKLLTACDTPRKLCRALTRIDALTRWLADRKEGLLIAEQKIFVAQDVYVEKLSARLGGLELEQEARASGLLKLVAH